MTGLFTDVRDVLFETAMRVKERMSETGKEITYPVQWDSPRQRAAFFATNGFGHGIPYVRKNVYELSWRVERFPFSTKVTAPHPAGAVGGMPFGWQSRIHRGRWNNLLVVLFEELRKIPQEINNKFAVKGDR